MKVFWAILGLCMLACAVLVYSEVAGIPGAGPRKPGEALSTDSSIASHDADARSPTTEAELAREIPSSEIAPGREREERAALAEELLTSAADREEASSSSGVGGGSEGAAESIESEESPEAHTSAATTEHESETPEAEPESSAAPATTSAAAPAPGPAPGSASLEPVEFAVEAIKGTTLIESTFARKSDGSLLADERYVIRGEGTKEKPFEISWDLLISASEKYQPRLGETALHGRIAMLHEKHVRITGYLAFPITSETFDELLVMLNQWDGCCIGVPPSPYDAIEVKLAAPINMKKRHMFIYGTVEGRLLVEPYLINEWLVGLYLMQDAKVELDY